MSSKNLKSTGLGARLLACVAAFAVMLGAVPAFGQHVHQLLYNDSNWSDTDLTSLTGAPTPAMVGITAFNTTPNDQLHIFYASFTDGHIHQLYNNGSTWTDEDETVTTGGMPQTAYAPFGPMSGFALGNAQYVYFCGADNDVHEYSYGEGGNWSWVDRNLNSLEGGSAANCSDGSNSLVAYATPKNGQRHVFYQPVEGSSDIDQLVLKGSSWYFEDETQTAKGTKGDGSWMAGFAIGTAQYVFFEDSKGNIHQLAYGAGGDWNWVDKNVTSLAKAPKSATSLYVGVAAFVVPGTSQIEVYYATSAFDTRQLTFKGSTWTVEDLGELGPAYESQFVSFATTPNNQFHVYYGAEVSPGTFGVNQQYFNGSFWQSQPLSSLLTEGGLAGFSIKNFQYVYYISFD
jgi:hypothetical protein